MFVKIGLVLGLVGMLILGVWWGNRPSPPRLIFLSVGQGDCTVFECQGAAILIDAGPKTREGFDAGARIVVPRLRAYGVAKIALIFLTHPDSDHIGGLASIMKANPEAQVAVSAQFRDHADLRRTLEQAGVRPEKVLWLSPREKIQIASFHLEIVNPAWQEGLSDNDGSTFIHLSDGRSSAVFSGDASIPVEQKVAAETGWRAQILRVGHHGSRTSTGEAWVNQIRPSVAVVSCGRDNSFGHPHASVLETLAKANVRVFRTDRDKDLIFEATSSGFVRTRP